MVHKLAARIRHSNFARGVFSIAGGTVIGQGIGVLLTPVLTRLYTPEAMGMWGLFTSFVGIAVVGGALRYEVAVVAAKDDDEAMSLAAYALLLGILTACGGGLVFSFLQHHSLLGYGVFPWWAGGPVVLAVVITIWGQVLRYWAVRRKKFPVVGYSVAGRGILRASGQLLLYPWLGWGLIVGEILGRVTSLWVLLREFPLEKLGRGRGDSLLFQGVKVLQKYKVYPLIFLPSAFLDTLAMMALVPVFAALYGIEIGGFLSLAQRVIGIPLVFLGAAIADVFFGEVAERARSNPRDVLSLFLKSTMRLGRLALFIGIGVLVVARRGVVVLFGAKWELVGRMLIIMVPWLMARMMVGPLSRLVFLSRYPWAKMVYDLLALGGMLFPLWLRFPSPLDALRFVSWSQATAYGVYWVILFVVAHRGVEVK